MTRQSRSSVASPPQTVSTTNAEARAAVHAPWAIGRRSPAMRAASTDRCSGLRSPPTRAKASIDVGAESSAVASVFAGRACRSGPGGASRARTAATGSAASSAATPAPAIVATISPPAAVSPTRRAAPSPAAVSPTAPRRAVAGGRLAAPLERARRRPARRAVVRDLDRRLGADAQHVARGELGARSQPRLRGEEVGVAGLRERQRLRRAARGAAARTRSPGRRRGSPARPRPRPACRARSSAARGSAGGSARRRGRRARRAGRSPPPPRPAAAARPDPGLTACVVWTSSDSRAASSG